MNQSIRFALANVVVLAVICLTHHVAIAQSQAPAGKTVLATVVDSNGRTQVDFGVDDFLIKEGDDEREVLDVHIADYPVIVLIDDAPAGAELEPIKSSVARFITRGGERPVAIGTLSTPNEFVASLEDSREEVLTRLARMTSKPGTPVTLPAVAHAARILQGSGAPFSAIVVVTNRAIDARIPVEGGLLPGIIESGAAVHVIESHASTALDPDAEPVPDLLKVLSEQTHGIYTTIFSSASYGTALDRLADKLGAEMMIQYLVPPGEGGGDVRVGVRRPGARVVGLGVK